MCKIRNVIAAAALVGAAASIAQAQFIITPYKLRGQPAPGMGANFFTFDRPNISESGGIAYAGDTDGATTSDDFLFVNETLIGREGDAAPGVPGGIYGTFSFFETASQININNDVIFENDMTGVATTEDLALFTSIGGVVTPVAREGQVAAGIPDRVHGAFSFPGLFNNGNYGYVADLGGTSTTDDSVIYRGTTPLYREGSPVPFLPPGTTWDGNFTEADWNGAGQLLFWGNTNAATNDQILVRDTNGVAEVVLREGDPIAGGPNTLGSVLQVALAENGTWALRGTLTGQPGTSDSFLYTGDGFFRQEGSPVPELGAGVVTGNLNGIDVNSNGDVLSLADIIGAADPNIDEGLFFNDMLIITDGVQAPGLPAGTLLTDIGFEDLFINDQGLIVFQSLYSDGTTAGDGLFTVVVPEPASLGLLGLPAIGLLGRRHRRGN